MKYPGRIIKLGEQDPTIVAAVKRRLNQALGFAKDAEARLDETNPSFGPKTVRAVKLFQTRNLDSEGRPLKQDGELGSISWAALFGEKSVAKRDVTKHKLLSRVLRVAAGEEEKGVREVPRNSNRGPEVVEYLKRAGVSGGNPWCCAFIYWCFDEAANSIGVSNPMVKTAGCLNHWNRAESHGATRITRAQAVADPSLIKPGMVFIMDFGGGLGHTGLIESIAGGFITTIEGNTDASKTREGGGVYRLTRKIPSVNKGFIDYSGV
jgi:hypothetical protein